ncbi:unnamed protein product [Knipowitschia caucasica]
MQLLLSLLLPLLQMLSLMQAASLPTDVRGRSFMKGINMADQLLHKISSVPIPDYLKTPVTPMNYSLCSMIHILKISADLIANISKHTTEIKTEIHDLNRFMEQSRLCQCGGIKPQISRDLQELQSRARFSKTVTPRVCYLLTKYLTNMDRQESC